GVPDASCIYYRVVSTDNVGNTATFETSDVVMVDRTPPTGLIGPDPAGPIGGVTNTIFGTSFDGQSGIQRVDVRWIAPDSSTGDICLGPPSPESWSCNWNTTLTPVDGTYTIELTVTDVAGNTFVYTRDVVV